MRTVAIDARGLGKKYALGVQGYGYETLREGLVRAVRSAGSRSRGAKSRESLWALRDVSLEIGEGETVGLIGHNGAGKSTFLKILSRITEPTVGYVDIHGRVGSLLEVGTGFHPELTGRENVYLNGSIIGMRRAEIRSRFDEIVAFADIEKFLDTPVKRYSSGMSVRLAFAVAAHLEPEILLVDEVLAVGDAAFQRKSLGKMSEVARQGRTVVFVSHNLAVIQALCQRAVLLEHGRVVVDAPASETIAHYLRTLERAAATDLLERLDRDPRGWRETRIAGIEIVSPGDPASGVVVTGGSARIIVHLTNALPSMECRLTIVNDLGQPLATLTSEVVAPQDVRDPSVGPRIECDVDSMPFIPGRYRLDVLVKGRRQIQDGLEAAAFVDVEPGIVAGRPVPAERVEGDVFLPHRWRLPA